jgi:predicted naringenin-chalcone synthase
MSQLAMLPVDASKRKTQVAIFGIGTASPPTISQEEILEVAIEISRANPEQQTWLNRVYLRGGIERRSVVLVGENNQLESLRQFYPLPVDANDRGPTTAKRMERYAIEAPLLAAEAAANALIDSGIEPRAITHLITASCTGFFAPGLDAALINTLGLARDVKRLHVGFMGCHAAFNALAAARDAVLADPSANVLVCCVELCSLHMAYGWDPGKLVANALFADGAAAVVVGRSSKNQTGDLQLRDTSSFLLPGSLDAMAWRIGDHGFEMTLLPSVPQLIRQHLRGWCENWLATHDLQLGDIAGWAIHPGGPKVLSAVAEALDLPPDALRYSRKVLAQHGNMSSATVLFIVEEMAEGIADGPIVAIGLGPGLTAEGMLLHR